MLDYEYHYPLTPIQSASHNIHPAFRNDPEFTDMLSIDEHINQSTTSLVPPPRNPLRLAVKPLFSASAAAASSSSLSLASTLGDGRDISFAHNSPEIVTRGIPDLGAAESLKSPSSPTFNATRSSSQQSSHKGVLDSDLLPPYERLDRSKVALDTPKPVSSHATLERSHRSSSTFAARTLSSLPCPPSLPPQDWSLFLRELQNAAALSKTQKTLAVAVALAVPIGCPFFKGLVLWGVWRHQVVKNVRLGLEDGACYQKKRGKESVEAVVQRWNEKWEEQEVRVDLEVKTRTTKKVKGEKGRLRVVVTELAAWKEEHDNDEYEYMDGVARRNMVPV